MKKRVLLTAAFLALSLVFSGCSSETQPEGTTPETTPAAETPAAAETDPAETEPAEEVVEKYTYDRVVLLGVDGAGAFFEKADTPNIDRIFENGAKTYDVLTSDPTISAECWGAMLHGVTPNLHRLTNSIVEYQPYDPESPFPSVFRVIREQNPDVNLAAFCAWNPINVGIIEDGFDVHKETSGGADKDAALTQQICNYVAENDPQFLFAQFDLVDVAGHTYGYGTKQHLDRITVTDTLIAQIYEAYEKRGFLDSTLFIVTADHGGKGTSHGGLSDEEKYVMFAAVGGNVVEGSTIQEMEIRDCASIVLHALGYEQPENWTSRVPAGLFEDVETAAERPVYVIEYSKEYRTRDGGETPDPSELEVLFGDRITAYLPMDESIDLAIGDYETAQSGKLYYVSGFSGSGIQFDDGYISLKDYNPGARSFSVSLWMKTGGVSSDPALFSNKDWMNGSNRGYVLALRGSDVKFNLGNGSNRMDVEYQLPLDYENGWVHVALVVDREAAEVRFAYDFGEFITAEIPDMLKKIAFNSYPNLNIGQDGTGNCPPHLSAVLDEFLMIDGVMTEEDLSALAEHYGAK